MFPHDHDNETSKTDQLSIIEHVKAWKQRLAETAPESGRLHNRARAVLAGGVTHDNRYLRPFPVAIERAAGPLKWDVDGNEYVDYAVGHGALLLGHSHPAVVEAIREQAGRGTHFGGSHRAEIEWAELVCRLVPSAERVRFTSSGTEAAVLASRVARAFTGRPKIVKFHGHFHGWSEVGLVGLLEPFDAAPVGSAPGTLGDVVALSSADPGALEEQLAAGDVAAVVIEPSGAHFGQVPLEEGFVELVRALTLRHGVLLVFDEVITGFRWAPGGAQERFGITPDLTMLAKVLGGGLPAGAVAGSADVMEVFELREDPDWNRFRHLFHPGTFNANPLSAAAGIAALREVSTGEPTAAAESAARELRDAMRAALAASGVSGEVYGEASAFHVYLGETPARDEALLSMGGPKGMALRGAMLARGVDLLGSSGMLSSAHGPEEIERTVSAFAAALEELGAAGIC